MTIKELIGQLSKFDDELHVYYINEEYGSEDEIEEIVKKKDYETEMIVLAREGAFG